MQAAVQIKVTICTSLVLCIREFWNAVQRQALLAICFGKAELVRSLQSLENITQFDSTNFLLYINEENGNVLTPAMNLLTVGTKRDSEKWPARDRRKDPVKLDLINFDLFSPYTVGKIVKGNKILQNLYETASKEREYVTTNGMHINRLMLKTSTNIIGNGNKNFSWKMAFLINLKMFLLNVSLMT